MSWKGLGQTGGKAETLFAPEEGKERGTVWIRHGDSARWVLLGLLEWPECLAVLRSIWCSKDSGSLGAGTASGWEPSLQEV